MPWWAWLPLVAVASFGAGFVACGIAAARRREDLNREIAELETALGRRAPAATTHRRE
jgi:hypothetical protein